ncbi:hypothetical protein ACHAXR_006256 [Thalassiosira sp. AJA248-18]
MTTSLRKAKRCQTVAKKRHMKLPNSSTIMGSDAKTQQQQQQQENPYSKDSSYIKETIEVAASIVHAVCSQEGVSTLTSLTSLLERMCILLTPEDNNIIDGSKLSGSASASLSNRSPPVGVSYDSSMAGVAANSLLSQFVDGQKQQRQQQQQQPSPRNNLAFLLAGSLASILLDTTNNNHAATSATTTATRTLQIKAAIALNQLAAMEPPPPLESSFDQEQFSPYGHPQNISIASTPTSWCYVLVHSDALSALVQQLPSSPNTTSSATFPSNDAIELCDKCVWSIGNLAGDSEMAREALKRMEALPRLISCISMGVSVQQQQQRSSINQSAIELVRNSVWALTNLFREGGMPASEFLDIHDSLASSSNQGRIMPRLASRDVAMLLSAPETFPPNASISGNSMGTTKTTWNDVAIETCWLVSFLTRDPMAVDFLCGEEQNVKNNFISMLVSRLVQATDAAMQQPHTTNNTSSLIPCCRALRNMAIASEGRYVSSIFLAETHLLCGVPTTSTNNDDRIIRPVESSLAKLISFGTLGAGNEASTIASEAAATAGACLYNAGLPLPHPATYACRTLVPSLCLALVCSMSTFEFRREVVWALWNAVDFPPELYRTQDVDMPDAKHVQKDLLAEIIRTSPTEIARALTTMLSTLDSDALEASLHLIHSLLLQLDRCQVLGGKKVKTLFEEAGLVDALWRVCDHDSEESDTAELAAGIIDDFYEQEEEEETDETLEPTAFGGQFQFQLTQGNEMPEGGFNFGVAAPLRQEQHLPPAGRGRGRGHVLPAWMQRQQQT